MLFITAEQVARTRRRLTEDSYLIRSLQASTETIASAPTGEHFYPYALGVLRGMLSNLAGLSGLAHDPVFDEQTTAALADLVATLEERLGQ